MSEDSGKIKKNKITPDYRISSIFKRQKLEKTPIANPNFINSFCQSYIEKNKILSNFPTSKIYKTFTKRIMVASNC